MSVSKSADELKGYLNGIQQGATLTGLGAWTSTTLIGTALAGASTTVPVLPWKGGESHVMIADPFEYPAGRLRIPIDAADVDSSGNIYAGRGSTIYKSTDGGDTWEIMIEEIAFVRDIVYDPRNSDWVYAATEGYGVLRSFNGGETWSTIYNQPTAQFYHLRDGRCILGSRELQEET